MVNSLFCFIGRNYSLYIYFVLLLLFSCGKIRISTFQLPNYNSTTLVYILNDNVNTAVDGRLVFGFRKTSLRFCFTVEFGDSLYESIA